ncbi:MAG: hypothetical protein LAT82_00650 [Nanoarchaeota archaeon]|nr:hypothetical protein [Nanoarchaeota archaeon]
MSFEIVEIDALLPHEEVDFENYEVVSAGIAENNVIERAIIIDKKSNVILDGHHRYSVLLDLGCKFIPVVYVNYVQDSSFILDFYPNRLHLRCTKEEIIKKALNGKLLPYKTTKHTHNLNLTCNVDLDRLF